MTQEPPSSIFLPPAPPSLSTSTQVVRDQAGSSFAGSALRTHGAPRPLFTTTNDSNNNKKKIISIIIITIISILVVMLIITKYSEFAHFVREAAGLEGYTCQHRDESACSLVCGFLVRGSTVRDSSSPESEPKQSPWDDKPSTG